MTMDNKAENNKSSSDSYKHNHHDHDDETCSCEKGIFENIEKIEEKKSKKNL